MADLKQIRAGLAANLAAIDDVQVSAYMLDNPTPPTIMVVGPDTVDYDLAMQRGLDMWTIVIQGFSGVPSDRGRQTLLDQWLAPSGVTSVKAAIEADHTLGGIVASARVSRIEAYREYLLVGSQRSLLGASWFVEIYTQPS